MTHLISDMLVDMVGGDILRHISTPIHLNTIEILASPYISINLPSNGTEWGRPINSRNIFSRYPTVYTNNIGQYDG